MRERNPRVAQVSSFKLAQGNARPVGICCGPYANYVLKRFCWMTTRWGIVCFHLGTDMLQRRPNWTRVVT